MKGIFALCDAVVEQTAEIPPSVSSLCVLSIRMRCHGKAGKQSRSPARSPICRLGAIITLGVSLGAPLRS